MDKQNESIKKLSPIYVSSSATTKMIGQSSYLLLNSPITTAFTPPPVKHLSSLILDNIPVWVLNPLNLPLLKLPTPSPYECTKCKRMLKLPYSICPTP